MTRDDGGPWRCFHCDEVFRGREDASLHFGSSQYQTPVCKIAPDMKGLVELLRAQESELQKLRTEELTDSFKTFYSLGASHTTALMREEERGYERGLADGRAMLAARKDDRDGR